jgi:hypothetical protein
MRYPIAVSKARLLFHFIQNCMTFLSGFVPETGYKTKLKPCKEFVGAVLAGSIDIETNGQFP